MSGKRPPLIAIVGCDGSGKSTVSKAVLEWVMRFGPAEAVHLGKQSGNVGRALGRLPLVGKRVDREIVRQSATAHGGRGKANPRLFPALIVYAFTLRRVRRFQRMMALWESGKIIVADRFPQTDVPHAYDGTILSTNASGSFFVRRLAKSEREMFDWMTNHRPDLVIRLNVDIETALARKPDHRRDALSRKIAATPLFTFKGAPIVEIDSTKPLEEVVSSARNAVSRLMQQRGYSPPID